MIHHCSLATCLALTLSVATAQEKKEPPPKTSPKANSAVPMRSLSKRLPAFDGGYHCVVGWFAIRPPFGGRSFGIHRTQTQSGPFVKRGIVHHELGYEGEGEITAESGQIFQGWAFSTGLNVAEGLPKYLFLSYPGYHLLSYRENLRRRWKYIDRCIKEPLLDLRKKKEKPSPKPVPDKK